MSAAASPLARRNWWTALVGLVALATWVVAFGVGWRAWILRGDAGIVAHVDAAGVAAAPWMIVAAILTLTTVVMGIGVALVRHLVDGPVESEPEMPTREELEPLPQLPERDTPALGAADPDTDADGTEADETDAADAGDTDAADAGDTDADGSDAVDPDGTTELDVASEPAGTEPGDGTR